MGNWRTGATSLLRKTKIRIANIGAASVLAVTGLGGILPMFMPSVANATPVTIDISTVQQLCDAITNQADGQTWDIEPGTYGLSQCSNIVAGGQTGWYFPITANNITINGIGDPTVYGTGFTQNGNWATQDLVAIFGNNVTVNNLTLMDKIEPNKTIEVMGSGSTIENVNIIHNTLVDQSEYNQTMGNLTNEEAQQWNGSIYYNNATGTNTLTNVNITNGGISVEAPAATIDMNNVNLSYSSNIDWINDYRVYSPLSATINGAPTYTYHVNSTLNNLDSVLANYGDPTTVAGTDIISLDSDVTAGAQINLARSVVVDGNGHAITAGAGSYTNSALLNVTAPSATISNLTANANHMVHNAVNVYAQTATNTVALNDTTLENGNYGLVVNGANVTVDNLTTSGNFYAGADVDQGSGVTSPSTLTVLGVSHHNDILLPGIYVDDTTKAVAVNDPGHQYLVTHPGFRTHDAAYTLKPAPPAAPTNLFAHFQYDPTHLTSGSGLNKTAEPGNNNLELEWTAPSGPVSGYHILATFPDMSTKTFYQGANPYSWLAKNKYNNGDEFGQHGQGAYTYQVVAVNAGGNSQPSASFTLYYETSQQHATISAPRYVNGNFQVTLKAHDTVGFTSLGVDVRKGPNPDAASAYINAPCTEDSISPALSTVSPSGSGVDITYTCTVNTANLVNGQTYFLRATGRNLAGYYFAKASSPYAEFTYDTSPPAVPTNLSWRDSSGKVVTNGYTNAQKGTLSWQDTDSGVNHYVYKFWTNIPGYFDGAANAWTTDSSQYITTSPGTGGSIWTNFYNDQGTYYFCVEAVDAASNTSACSNTYTLTYDNQPPVVSITNPTNNGIVKGTVAIAGNIQDANPDHYYLVVKNAGGKVVTGPGTVNQAVTSFSYNWDTTKLPDGVYTIDLEARDAANNKSAASVQTINVTVNNTPPAITINSYGTTGNVIQPNVTVTDQTATTYDWVANDTASATNVTVHSSTDLEPLFTANASGTYSFTVTATDAAGNTSSAVFTFTYTAPGNNFTASSVTTPTPSGTNGGNTSPATTTLSNNGTGATQAVLGASTNSPSNTGNTGSSSNNGNVKGDSTPTVATTINAQHSNFLGLGWWWLLVLAALAAFVAYWRSGSNANTHS